VLVASSIAERIGVAVPFDGYDDLARRLLRLYGLSHFVTDVRSFALAGWDVPPAEMADRAVEVMRDLADHTGAQCIVPLGGAVIPYMVDPADLEPRVGVPVLNTKSIGIGYAEMCVRLGITHSPATYPVTRLRVEDFATCAGS
jgi:Asp/Glu/hydantoin racemase